MNYRSFGKTGFEASEIGLGTWQIGGEWGDVDEATSMKILNTAVDTGINFFDTSDVYGMGRSEKLIGRFLQNRDEEIFVATKVGRRNYPGPYTREKLRQHINGSRQRLQVDSLDLVQLHCIPTEVLAAGVIFNWLREAQEDGLIKAFGASVESMDEALLVLEEEGLASIQIIFNIFRQKPTERVLDLAADKDIGVIARIPLASGLLTGKFNQETTFSEDDHRHFNRDGQDFNVGETFVGLRFVKGVELADMLKPLVPEEMSMAQFALRWVLDHDAVSVVIPGASRPSQVAANAQSSDYDPLPTSLHERLENFYRSSVHEHIRGPY